MEIINERLNYSIPSIKRLMDEAYETKNFSKLREIYQSQKAYRMDLNIGTLPIQMMEESVKAIQGYLCIDSDDINKLEAGLMACDNQPILNSCTIQRLNVLNLRRKKPFKVILMDDKYESSNYLFGKAISNGFKPSDIYLDPSIYPISVDEEGRVKKTINLIRRLKRTHSHLHTKIIVGLSNLTFGLPNKLKLPIQNAFLTMTKPDAIIGDPRKEYKYLNEKDEDLIKFNEVLNSDNPLRTLVNNFLK